MSGLARLLAGHTPPGVYHWTSAADVATVQHAAERAGWRFVLLDTWKVEDKSGARSADITLSIDRPSWVPEVK